MSRPLLERCTFPAAGFPVTCAVSGGPDSLALLLLATAAGCDVTAIHVDHGLRPGSADEADIVRDAAACHGAAFRAERVAVQPGPNLEARAREARYAVLPPDVLTGHTADDQAETVLINLLRGAGLSGLSGIRPERRPLLALRRHETRALCDEEGLTPILDPSNNDPVFLRNRVRHELLPLLNDLARRDVVPILARQADLLRDEADLLDTLAAGVDGADAHALRDAAPALARRVIRALLSAEHPPDAAAVERVLGVARGDATATEVSGGRRVARSGGRLRVDIT